MFGQQYNCQINLVVDDADVLLNLTSDFLTALGRNCEEIKINTVKS